MPEIRLINMTAITEQLRVIEQNDKLTDAQKFRLAEFVVVSAPTIEPEVKKPKTNGDRIRQMTDDEELLSTIGTECYRCAYRNGECDSGYGEGCIAGNLEWLKQEVQEDATDRC